MYGMATSLFTWRVWSIWLLWNYILLHTAGKSSKKYEMPSTISCTSSRTREIDGALIVSGSNPYYINSACIMRFVADDASPLFSSKRILVNFEELKITDCTVSLKIYFSSFSSGQPAITLDCKSVKPDPIISTSKYVTLRLDKRTDTGYHFKIVLTTFKSTGRCSEFLCGDSKCIDDDLRCDHVTNCLDGSDEQPDRCAKYDYYPTFRKATNAVVIGGALTVLFCCLLCVGLTVFCCRRRRASYGSVSRDGQITSTTLVNPNTGQQSYSPPIQPQYGQLPPPAYGAPCQQPQYTPQYPQQQPYYAPGQPSYPPSAPPPDPYDQSYQMGNIPQNPPEYPGTDPCYPPPASYNVNADQVKVVPP